MNTILFTENEKNNCFSIYTGSDLNNIFRRKPLKIDLIDLSIHAWKTCKQYKACANMENLSFQISWPSLCSQVVHLLVFKISDSETLAKRAEFTPAILFLFGLRIIYSVGSE